MAKGYMPGKNAPEKPELGDYVKKIPTLEDLATLKAKTLEAQKASDHAAEHEGITGALDAASNEAWAWREYAEALEAHLGIKMREAEEVDQPSSARGSTWFEVHIRAGNHMPVQHRDGKEPWCASCRMNAEGNVPISRFEETKYEGPEDVFMEMAADQQMKSQEEPPTPSFS